MLIAGLGLSTFEPTPVYLQTPLFLQIKQYFVWILWSMLPVGLLLAIPHWTRKFAYGLLLGSLVALAYIVLRFLSVMG